MATEYAAESPDVAPTETGDPSQHPAADPKLKAPELPDEAQVLEEFNARFKHSKQHHDGWREEYKALCDMVAGRQWDPDDEARLKDEGRPVVTFNLSGKYLDAIVGLQINNRQDIKFLPRELGDAKANELLTGAVQWGRDLTDVADDETDAFWDCVLGGYGWMEGYLDKDTMVEGVPTGQRVDPLEMFPDPAARKRNLTDSRYVIRVKWVDKDEYADITGATADDDSALAELEAAEEEDVLTVIEEPQDYETSKGNAGSTKRGRKPVAEYEFWRREDRIYVQAGDRGPQLMELNEWAYYEPMLQQARWRYKAQVVKRKVYYRARICAGVVRELKRSPYQDGFTKHAITGKRDRNKGVFFGIGRALVDPQKWVNKFFSTILFALMVGAKGGLLAEEDAFKDPRKAESEWANPSAITWLNSGALGKGKVEPKPNAQYPEGLERLMQFTVNAIPQVSGLNAELMGLSEKIQAGVLEAQRKQSAMAIISWAFDAMRRYYRSMGRQMASYVLDYMPEGTLVLINGEGGRQYVQLLKSQFSKVFDVVVDEAPTSTNMKERVWAVLETLIPQCLQAGLKIPQEILDYSPLPTDLVDKWKETLKPDPQQQQLAQTSAMKALEKLVAEVQKLDSEGKLNQAKAAEIIAELQKPPGQELDAFKTQLEAQVDMRIAEFKANRESETRILMKEMDIRSEERIAQMNAMIDARLATSKQESETALARSRQESDAHSRIAVAAIARGKPDLEEEDLAKPDPVAVLTEAVQDLKQGIAELSKPRPPRTFKIKRGKGGEMSEVSEL